MSDYRENTRVHTIMQILIMPPSTIWWFRRVEVHSGALRQDPGNWFSREHAVFHYFWWQSLILVSEHNWLRLLMCGTAFGILDPWLYVIIVWKVSETYFLHLSVQTYVDKAIYWFRKWRRGVGQKLILWCIMILSSVIMNLLLWCKIM